MTWKQKKKKRTKSSLCINVERSPHIFCYCCLVTKSCLTLRPHGLWHPRLLCPPLSPGVCSHSCPLMAPHSSTLAWKIPWMEEPGRLQSMGSLRVGHDWANSLSLLTFMNWRRKWQPTPVFLPGESQGRGSLVGCRLWGRRVGHDWSDLAAAAACPLNQWHSPTTLSSTAPFSFCLQSFLASGSFSNESKYIIW